MKEITIPKIETEAKEFLKIKKSKNETTYKNYKTSLNYFIYYLNDIAKTTEINEINKYKLLEGFQAALYEGFTYTNAGKTRPVKVKANGTNTHIRRIKTFLKTIGMETKIPNLKVSKPEYKALKPEDIKLLINETNNKFNNKEIAVRTSVLIQFLFNTALRIEDSRFENVNVIEYSAIEEIYKVYLGFYLVEDLRKVVDTTEDYFYVTLYGHLDLVNCVHSESFKHNNFEGIPITILKLPIMDNHKNNLLSFIEEKLNKECTKVDF